MTRILLLAWVVLSACSAASSLGVQVRSDMTPAVEIDRARASVSRDGAPIAEQSVVLDGTRSLGRPLRIAAFESLRDGLYVVHVALEREGATVVARDVRVDVHGPTIATVLLQRDCRGIDCPGASGDATNVACLGSRCVPETCSEEHPESCPRPECVSATDCGAASAGCVEVGCTASGTCFAEPHDDRCASGEVCTTTGCLVARDPCVAIGALPSPPVLDGVLDPGVVLTAVPENGWTAAPVSMPDVPARAGLAWRPDGLYVYVEVDDATLYPAPTDTDAWCGDGVELYVDADGVYASEGEYDIPGTRQLVVASPSSTATTSTRGETTAYVMAIRTGAHDVWDPSRFVVITRPGGYALETFVQARELGLDAWTLGAGQTIGLDLSINVSTMDGATSVTACGVRLGQYFQRTVPSVGNLVGQPYADTRAFCTPILF